MWVCWRPLAIKSFQVQWPVIVPDTRPLLYWELTGLMFLIIELITIPYRISFNSPAKGGYRVLEDISTTFFICDLTLQFFQGYHVNGMVVLDPRKIIVRYLKRWFWIDLVASFPWTWIFSDDDS